MNALNRDLKKLVNFIEKNEKESEEVSFLEKAVEILKEDGLDSQGIFEYMKEIIDISIGKENREKIWKKNQKKAR